MALVHRTEADNLLSSSWEYWVGSILAIKTTIKLTKVETKYVNNEL